MEYTFDIWRVIFAIFILGGVFFGIAVTENKIQPKLLFYNRQIRLFEAAIILLICLSVFFFWLNKNKINGLGEGLFLIVGLKIIMAFIVSGQARNLGRSRYLWFFLSLIEYHLALIVLGLNPKLIRVSSLTRQQVRDLNQQTRLQNRGITNAYQRSIIDRDTLMLKRDKLRETYTNQLMDIFKSESRMTFMEQLNNALKTGVISQEEYDAKIIVD